MQDSPQPNVPTPSGVRPLAAGLSAPIARLFDSPAALAESVAATWIDRVAAATGAGHRVALAGGRIARLVLDSAAAQAARRRVDWSAVDFFWGDERCVDPTSPESNFALAKAALLDPAAIAPGRIHRIAGEIEPAAAVIRAEAEFRQVCPPTAGGRPQLDLVLLGLGEDGHIASLFPDLPPGLWESPDNFITVVGPKPPPRRISLTLGALAAAREIWVVASGEGKAGAWRASLDGRDSTPLARLLSRRPDTWLWADHAVAGAGV